MTAKAPLQASGLGTVLVIGGCGFVGSNVVDQLLNFPSEDNLPAQSHSIPSRSKGDVVIQSDHVFPSLRSRYPSYNTSTTSVHALDLRCVRNRFSGCTYHEADITSEEELIKVFDQVKPDIVINTASPTFDAPKPILQKVNIEGTRTLIQVAKTRCKVFVHTSSSSVVHDNFSDLHGATEEYPYVCPNPREYYSETKVHAERMVLAANDPSNNFLTCAVRPAGIMGEGDRSGIGYSISHAAATGPAWNFKLQLGDNNNLFDCTYVGNVAYGLLCAAQVLNAQSQRQSRGNAPPLDMERVDGEAFNVTNSEPAPFWDLAHFIWSRYGIIVDRAGVWVVPASWAISIGTLAEAFSKLTGRDGRYTAQTARHVCMTRWFSSEKLMRRTGYDAKVGIEEGLERTVRWYKDVVEGERKNRTANGVVGKKTQ